MKEPWTSIISYETNGSSLILCDNGGIAAHLVKKFEAGLHDKKNRNSQDS